MSRINFEVANAEIVESSDPQFSIAKIHAFSSGDNLHDMWCDVDTLKKTSSTMDEKPIVFDIDERWDDFGGHNDKNEPRIAGFAEKDSAEFYELDDGRTAFSVRVKIWKYYAKDFMRIFERDDGKKKVSVEMDLKEVGEEDSRGFRQMLDWAYSAICVLGDLLQEASPKAHMQILSFSEHPDKEKYFDKFAKYDRIDFKIPSSVKKNAERGLELRKKYGRGGTSVGMATARYLVKNTVASPQKVRHIAKYFPRHAGDNLDDKTSAGWIAWLLWGSNAGRRWSEKIVKQMNSADDKMMAYFEENVLKEESTTVEMATSDEVDTQEENLLAEDFASGKEENMKEKDEKAVETEAEVEDENVMMEEKESEEEAPPEEESGDGEYFEKESDDEEEAEAEEEQEEEMSMNSYQRMEEMLAMLESEEADFSFDEKSYPVLDSILDKFSALKEERDSLFEYKKNQEEAQKAFEVDKTIAGIKQYVPEDKIAELKEDAANFSIENIDGWKNKANAIAFEYSKDAVEEDEEDGFVKWQFPIKSETPSGTGGLWDEIG